MRQRITNEKRRYTVLVNRPELYEAAVNKGFENITLHTKPEFSVMELLALKKRNKAVALLYCNPESDPEDKSVQRKMDQLRKEKIECWRYNIAVCFHEEPEREFDTLSEAVEHFPSVHWVEKELCNRRLIDETDYIGLCGNCHEHLYKNDKYCRYCGTERGKGSFRPFRNAMFCVYGPQVKKKYRCSDCGHIWITAVLGGDDSRFCPECGKPTANVIEMKDAGFPLSNCFGMEEPFPPDERPVLFKEAEIQSLLNLRSEKPDRSFVFPEEGLKAMRKAGMNVPEEIDRSMEPKYPRTEAEGEQLSLACRILELKGSNIHGYRNCVCPYCKGNLIAGIKYSVPTESKNTFKSVAMPAEEKDPLICDSDSAIRSFSEKGEHPAYLCLTCGGDFGELQVKNL